MAVEHFMKEYYRTVMELSRLNEMLLQLFQEALLYADDDTPPGPVSSAGDGSATRDVPRAFSPKAFWPAGRTGAGFDDPAWDASSDFVTFDEMLEVVGADESDQS